LLLRRAARLWLRRARRQPPPAQAFLASNNASRKHLSWGCRMDRQAMRNMCANVWGGGLATLIQRPNPANRDSTGHASPKSGLRALLDTCFARPSGAVCARLQRAAHQPSDRAAGMGGGRALGVHGNQGPFPANQRNLLSRSRLPYSHHDPRVAAPARFPHVRLGPFFAPRSPSYGRPRVEPRFRAARTSMMPTATVAAFGFEFDRPFGFYNLLKGSILQSPSNTSGSPT
jgi:hypothetical protein